MKKYSIVLILLLLIGCNGQNNNGTSNANFEPNYQLTKSSVSGEDVTKENVNQDNVFKAKNIVLEQPEVKMIRAVEGKKLLIIALELTHWNTFQSKKVTKEMKKKLEKEIPSKKIEVTTDHKIFIELEKLENKLNNNELTKKQLDKKLEKIQKLMKEQT